MAAASPAHTFEATESSSPRLFTIGENNDLSEQEQSEPMIIGTNIVGEENMTIENSSQNPEHLQSEIGIKFVGSDAQVKYLTEESSSLMQNTLVKEKRHGSASVENELVGTGMSNQNPEHLQSEMGIIIVGSDAQVKYLTGESSRPMQNTLVKEQRHGFAFIKNELVENGMSEPVVQEHCLTEGCSSPDPITIGKRQELASEQVQNEPMTTRMVEFAASNAELLVSPYTDENINTPQVPEENKDSSRSMKRKYMSRSSEGTVRVLRSRSQDICKPPPDPNMNSANVIVERKKKRRKKKKTDKVTNDEFSKVRRRVRYLLTRMGYEQNLIDAYSGEGWKGQSAEKVKPEKELQRATSEILHCKLKIRDLFQHLDALCSEGRHQESLFDSEGEISSEDIFCAKCGCKDLFAHNDIILCDGTCDRGFHQMCLDPPLLKEEIPPGDEGWLCPGCDCKVDCMDLLNDYQETDLSIEDNWEMVFPEAAATKVGDNLDENFGLPSDDSEDNDYDPDGPEVDMKVQAEDSSSEESDFTSASDDSGVSLSPKEVQFLGLPSDDSEDDDYDPSALDLDQKINNESSSSDFTSDSEDFSLSDDANRLLGTDEKPTTARKKKPSVNSEMLSLLESDSNEEPVSGKRHIEGLDYKKLHDEAYGNVTDSSDDEDWIDMVSPRKRKTDKIQIFFALSPTGKPHVTKRKIHLKGTKQNLDDNTTAPEGTSQKLEIDGSPNGTVEANKAIEGLDCIRKSDSPSALKLGKARTQVLLGHLKENPYPTRERKEYIAKELGVTYKKVKNWFDSTRKGLHKSLRDKSIPVEKGSKGKKTLLNITNGKLCETEPVPAKNSTNDKLGSQEKTCKTVAMECSSGAVERKSGENTPQILSSPKNIASRKTSKKALSSKVTFKNVTPIDSPATRATRRNSRNTNQRVTRSQTQTRTRKTVV
ncbi:hypothetical protein GIB67_023606 [Kingdonia uniflora]|uniref:Pathogenesis-related homeodomain protein n=1 Tax=Kingdonia uniflora TaxID=39325 RepID=A0A7J7L527_9MAGN|nr:hypothetical protein GIB67_023606 [Kingdonia uniflora]